MENPAVAKPAVIFLMGEKTIPRFRRAGYTKRSRIGIKMTSVMGSRLEIKSLGRPLSLRTAACDVLEENAGKINFDQYTAAAVERSDRSVSQV